MTKIRDVKFEIEDLEITMDEAITIQVLNSLNSSFTQFLGILSYKARFVAHGFKQEEGIDFVETFAAFVKPISYKCLFGVSVKRGYKIRQIDVVTDFLYGFLDEVIYVE